MSNMCPKGSNLSCTHLQYPAMWSYWLYHKPPLRCIMQVLQQTYKVEELQKKENLLEILSDRYCRTIIECITDKSKSAMEIASETKVPISTVYRRIQMLTDGKLLYISGNISEDGKKFFLYKTKVKGISSQFNNGSIEVQLTLNHR